MRNCGCRLWWVGISVLALLIGAVTLRADEPAAKLHAAAGEKFKQLDKDADGRLSVDEYVAGRDSAPVHRRDFVMFDANGDGFLSLPEFTPIAQGVDAQVRGPLPDPVVKIVDLIAAALDKSLNNWDKRPDEEQDAPTFVHALSARFS